MDIPQALCDELNQLASFDLQAFLAAHSSLPAPVSVRVNEAKSKEVHIDILDQAEKIAWCNTGYYIPERPSFSLDPLWHAGAYYVQEASSMILEQVWYRYIATNRPLRVLDLCAAPGGKSTHLLSLMKSSDVLVSNETISSRVPILLENISRWGKVNCIITQSDASAFGQMENIFDCIVIDAPCSGSGLFRKDPHAIIHWSEEAVITCSLRQKRIIADVLPSLRDGGILVYSTCSYSFEENEKIVEWLSQDFQLTPLQMHTDKEWGWRNFANDDSTFSGIRAFPHLVKGEGFYLCVFQKGNNGLIDEEDGFFAMPIPKTSGVPNEVSFYIKPNDDLVWKGGKEKWWCMPKHVFDFFNAIEKTIRVKKAGCFVGEHLNRKFLPSQDLALSELVSDEVPQCILSRDEALQFLRGEVLHDVNALRGMLLCQYKGLPIGWGKNIGSRINNLLPKEWRLRKTT